MAKPLPSPAQMKGPAAETNWLIPEKFLVGCCPDDIEHAKEISDAGVVLFLSLLDAYDYKHHISRRTYRGYADKLGFSLVMFPITDGYITSDERAFKIARTVYIFLRLYNDGALYLHCLGGHGRAGTIGAMVVGLWYRTSLEQTFAFLKLSHDTREGKCSKATTIYKTPQTQKQVQQVARFFDDIDNQIQMTTEALRRAKA